MIKQADLFRGDELIPSERYEMERKERDAFMKQLMRDWGLVVMPDTSCPVVKERDYVRTAEGIYKIRFMVRKRYFVSKDVISKEEVWLETKTIWRASKDVIDVLDEGDKIMVRDENKLLRPVYFITAMGKKGKVMKIAVKDCNDESLLVLDKNAFVRVLEVKAG